MTTQTPIRSATAEGHTERVDAIACLDESVRQKAFHERPDGPGRYLEIQGTGEALLIPLGTGVMHIGRGLSADLHLDEKSVSRRHAMLVPDRPARGCSTIAAPTARSSTGGASFRPTCTTGTSCCSAAWCCATWRSEPRVEPDRRA